MRHRVCYFALAFSLALWIPSSVWSAEREIVIENAEMRLLLSSGGKALSLVHKPTGEECLAAGVDVPLCAITQHRPYDNENFLMFPAKPRVFPSNRIERVGDELHVEFQDTYDIAVIALKITDAYIGFELKRIDYRIEDFGVKRKTEIDEFALLQLPVKPRAHFGEWLNVMWDDRVAVNVLGTDPAMRIDAFPGKDHTTMYAGLDFQVKLFGPGAVLITTAGDSLLDRIDRVERDYGLPLGVESRRSEPYRYSYYELRDVTTGNIDEHIAYARQGGFRTMVVYYVDFARACGHYQWRDEYPGGMEDLKAITDKIRAAGMIPGLHLHYSKVAVTDPYINNGIPDARMNRVREMVLAEPLGAADTVITVEGNPDGVRMEQGRRLLYVGDELITYEGYTTQPPYRFTGCRRGVFNSRAADHVRGRRLALLDVDDWPLFIRVDQNTSIQREIAERLGEIYRGAGFRFVYFDGAEDVPPPYWYNVSRSQSVVYDALKPAPLFAEGALKSHYGWHILSRGNAFDIFPPERIRPAMKKYTLRCARQIANDFTSVNFGWVNYLAPQERTIGMQPDMYEYICSKALAWDSPISLVGNLAELRKHPRTEDNLRVIARWEEAKLRNAFTAEQKESLKDPDREFLLLTDRAGKAELYEYRQITTDEERPVRAFVFRRGGKTCILYWHLSGAGELTLPVAGDGLGLTDEEGRRVLFRSQGGKSVLPVAGRLVLETDLPEEEAVTLFRTGIRTVK